MTETKKNRKEGKVGERDKEKAREIDKWKQLIRWTVKLYLCTNKHYAVHSCGGKGGIGTSTKWTLVVSFTPRPLYSLSHRRWYLFSRRFDGTVRRSEMFEEFNISHCRARNLTKHKPANFCSSRIKITVPYDQCMTQWMWSHTTKARSWPEQHRKASIDLHSTNTWIRFKCSWAYTFYEYMIRRYDPIRPAV
jgi:hypothetical protein